jgi:type IV fimbrial biogenesis protein FimT
MINTHLQYAAVLRPTAVMRHRKFTRRRAAGFTMTELVVTMALAGILATVAVPSFNSVIANQRAKTYASELYTTLVRTRSEAIQRNANITLSPKAGGWNTGWQIFDPAGNLLEDRGPAAGVDITHITDGPAGVTYRPSGRLQPGNAPTFQITATSGSATYYQCVSVDLSGRPYIQAATC